MLFLKNFGGIKKVWEILDIYERATGMKVNTTKTEGLRLAKLREQEYNLEAGGGVIPSLKIFKDPITNETHVKLKLRIGQGGMIKWCPEGEHIISLGIPHGNSPLASTEVWKAKYNETKSLTATWHDLKALSKQGKAMLTNSMVFSRFRYLAYSRLPPK